MQQGKSREKGCMLVFVNKGVKTGGGFKEYTQGIWDIHPASQVDWLARLSRKKICLLLHIFKYILL
jgi:hypothetical protein